jgi:hypothetical protein
MRRFLMLSVLALMSAGASGCASNHPCHPCSWFGAHQHMGCFGSGMGMGMAPAMAAPAYQANYCDSCPQSQMMSSPVMEEGACCQ